MSETPKSAPPKIEILNPKFKETGARIYSNKEYRYARKDGKIVTSFVQYRGQPISAEDFAKRPLYYAKKFGWLDQLKISGGLTRKQVDDMTLNEVLQLGL